jgi:hypothetical protein
MARPTHLTSSGKRNGHAMVTLASIAPKPQSHPLSPKTAAAPPQNLSHSHPSQHLPYPSWARSLTTHIAITFPCLRSVHACSAQAAATSAPTSGRTGASCAECRRDDGRQRTGSGNRERNRSSAVCRVRAPYRSRSVLRHATSPRSRRSVVHPAGPGHQAAAGLVQRRSTRGHTDRQTGPSVLAGDEPAANSAGAGLRHRAVGVTASQKIMREPRVGCLAGPARGPT